MSHYGVNVGALIGVAIASGVSSFAATSVSSVYVIRAYRDGRLSRAWCRLRVCALGGITTLKQALGYDCGMCRRSLDQGEEVRTLSCDHVFHFRKSAKCENIIDDWLRENGMFCPACRKIAYPMLPWKAPPTSAPPPPPMRDLEAQVPLPSASEQRPPQQPPESEQRLPQWQRFLNDILLTPSLSQSPSQSQAQSPQQSQSQSPQQSHSELPQQSPQLSQSPQQSHSESPQQ